MSGPTSHTRKHAAPAMLFALIALGVILRLAHWHSGIGADDSRYMNYAAAMVAGEPPERLDPAAARFFYEAYLAVALWLFGLHTSVAAMTTLAAFVVSCVMLYLLTARLANTWAALAAVLLYDLLPVDITLSTQVLPDSLVTALVLTAAWLYLRSLAASRYWYYWIAASGGLLGAAMSVKEPAFCAAAALALHAACSGMGLRRWAVGMGIMAVTAAAVLGLEIVGLLWWTGDPWYRFHALAASLAAVDKTQPAVGFSWREAAYYLVTASNARDAFGVHFYLAAVALLLAIDRRSRAALLPVLWCLAFGLYLSAGSVSLTEYIIVPHRPRYFLPVAAMACALCGMELAELRARLALKRSTLLVAGLLVAALSLRAALDDRPSGMAATAQWLPDFPHPAGAPYEIAHDYVLLDSFVSRLALERSPLQYGYVNPYAVIDDSLLASAGPESKKPLGDQPQDLAAMLGGRGLVVPRFEGYDSPGGIADRLRKGEFGPFVAKPILAPAWPPYRRLFNRDAKDVVGHVWFERRSNGSSAP